MCVLCTVHSTQIAVRREKGAYSHPIITWVFGRNIHSFVHKLRENNVKGTDNYIFDSCITSFYPMGGCECECNSMEMVV